ncbi:MAG: hypothetical protein K1X29_00770 [Bdellovibrionales bacterium]|nr:hypothetical protein [Bdellovibrionales bacterium]
MAEKHQPLKMVPAIENIPNHGFTLIPEKQNYDPTIVFVHHFGGSRTHVKKHQQFVAQLGFKSVAFDLSFPNSRQILTSLFKSENSAPLLLRSRWSYEISQVLDCIEGDKILFSFSFPSNATAHSIANRKEKDILSWICDGGPFLKPWQCGWNLCTFQYPERSPLYKSMQLLKRWFAMEMWSFKSELYSDLQKFPENFPILSIRSWQDPLVPISAIDEAFSGNNKIHLETLTLTESGHLNGLRTTPQVYKPRVEDFLKRFSKKTPLDETKIQHLLT